ncbi:MAG TPA: alpha/beta hydrolase [Burkholderiales bacterium]|jgi:pimeloyl-ACP methyl ester carboxylesterase
MRQLSFQALHNGGFHRVAYTEWGDASNPHVVVCVHGLARNSRDFDYLAGALASDCRVVCMDVVGRGESEWLDNKSDYTFSTYTADAAAMLARATAPGPAGWFSKAAPVTRLDWVGTSMGGMIGMFLAAKRNSPIRRLVLNDVGALIPWSALFRMKGYVGHGVRFPSLERVEAHLREVCAPFGPLNDAQWRHLAEHSARRDEDGGYVMRYDPAIAQGMHGHVDHEFPMGPDVLRGIDLWNIWSKVSAPTLVLRGAESDVLRANTLKEMKERRPDTQSVEFAGVGHAPALMSADQISAVRRFLLR